MLALCELGQADGAQVICRTMFETYLTVTFIVRQSVRLRYMNSNSKVDLFGKKLTRDFRANLFIAHGVLQYEKNLENMQGVAGLKKHAKKQQKDRPANYSAMVARIGTDWKKQLRTSATCAGLSVADLSHSLNATRWYRAIYSDQSSNIHNTDSSLYLELSESGSTPNICLQSLAEDVKLSLWLGSVLMLLSRSELSRLLDERHARYVEERIFEQTYEDLKEAFGMNTTIS